MNITVRNEIEYINTVKYVNACSKDIKSERISLKIKMNKMIKLNPSFINFTNTIKENYLQDTNDILNSIKKDNSVENTLELSEYITTLKHHIVIREEFVQQRHSMLLRVAKLIRDFKKADSNTKYEFAISLRKLALFVANKLNTPAVNSESVMDILNKSSTVTKSEPKIETKAEVKETKTEKPKVKLTAEEKKAKEKRQYDLIKSAFRSMISGKDKQTQLSMLDTLQRGLA